MAVHVQSVEFAPEGLVVTYTTTDALRKDGALQRVTTLMIAPHPDYAEEMADLRDRAERFVESVEEDYHTAEVVELAEDEGGDDDDRGMGYG